MDIDHSKQLDNFNCGVIVCQFLESLSSLNLDLNTVSLDYNSLKQKRQEIYQLLKVKSLKKSEYCSIFGLKYVDNSQKISCKLCSRTYDLNCKT